MNILHVYPIFNPEIASGAAKVAYEVSKRLVKKGYNVTFLTSDMTYWGTKCKAGKYTIDNISVYRLKTFAPIIAKKYKISITPQLLSFCKTVQLKKFDIIHLHAYISFQNLVLYHFIKKGNVPYVLQAHGSIPRVGAWQRLKWIYDVFFGYKLLKDATKVIALSKVEAEQYKSVGVLDNKIAIIPNGIDLSEYAELPPKGVFKRKFNIPEDRKIILYLGRIHKIKGIDFLVKAYAYLKNEMKYRDALLVIAGPDDGYLGEIKSLVQALGISNYVLFVGPLYGEDKLAAYVDSEVYVLPSRYETFPMTILEAYACGKPVVASKVGGLKDLVKDKETGLLFESGNVEQLSKSIFNLLNNNNVAKEMGLKGKNFVRGDFAVAKTVERLEKVYEEARATL
jgi:glycosyltransferase involved in cell wall biosynthesis